MLLRTLSLLALLALASCISSPLAERQSKADLLVASKGWHKLRLPAVEFALTAYVPSKIAATDTLTIYIEGDGLAWLTRSVASDNPTPRHPVGLELATRHPHNAVAYLARPCQYVDQQDWGRCKQAYWTSDRFAPEVITASNLAIDTIKQRFGAKRLVLVGYSGGGAVAALIAARRHDVAQLVTVAGNLDHHAWTNSHHVQPLKGSLNPADAWQGLQGIPQLHLVGGKDKNITVEVVESFAARFPAQHRPIIKVVPDADHACCWAEKWPALLPPLPDAVSNPPLKTI